MTGPEPGLAEILRCLSGPRHPIAAAFAGAVPGRPGLYAIHGDGDAWVQLGLGGPPDDRPLYVGKAEDSLITRDLNTHFSIGRTGQSSPRRSFAALLVEPLTLIATPRRPQRPEPGRRAHYALEAGSDARLTAWMRERLTLAVWHGEPRRPLAQIERDVMQHWRPPLNLTGVRQPWKAQVKQARAAMADAARRWADEHDSDGNRPAGRASVMAPAGRHTGRPLKSCAGP